MAEKYSNPVAGDSSYPPQAGAYPPAYSSPPITTPPAPGVVSGPMGYGGGWGGMQHSASNTTVVINQTAQQPAGPRTWSSGVCSCCDDMGTCCLGAFCPCVLTCQIVSDMGESCCVPCCLPCDMWLIVLRTKLRAENNIMGSVMDDCCTVWFCDVCVMCQMKRELNYIRALRVAQQGTEMPQTTVVQSNQNMRG